jgi:hypothetical protein
VLTVVCVNAGNYLGRGQEYVDKLWSMVTLHLRQPFDFVVVTEADGFYGWWVKIALFEPGRFRGRVAYFDLDGVIVGPLDELVEAKGIIQLTDWGWTKPTYGSGVMVWDAGEHEKIYTEYSADVPQQYRGDQDWITSLGGWEPLPARLCRSYRYHCVNGPPEGCVHVSFHGKPKMHELPQSHWVHRYWRSLL